MARRAARAHNPTNEDIALAISQSMNRIDLIPEGIKATLNQVCINIMVKLARQEIDHTTALMTVCRTGYLIGVLAKEKNWKTEGD